MHQEAYQDAGHCHQDGVVVHTLQPYGEGREMNLSRSVLWQSLRPGRHHCAFPLFPVLKVSEYFLQGVPSTHGCPEGTSSPVLAEQLRPACAEARGS